MAEPADRCRFWVGLTMIGILACSQAPHLVSSCSSFAAQRAANPSLRPADLCYPWLIWRPSQEAPPLNYTLLSLLTIGWMATPRLRRWKRAAQESFPETSQIGFRAVLRRVMISER